MIMRSSILACLLITILASCGSPEVSEVEVEAPAQPASKKIPVILDTDIGTDIDDTWALALLLSLPELDLKLVVSDHGDTVMRARIAAKLLEAAGRTDVAVGVGKKLSDAFVPQSSWVDDYTLEQYPGTVHEDGIGAMIDLIMNSEEPVTLIPIGPVPNIKEALEREPRIAEKARIVSMSGSVDEGYGEGSEPDPEYNVKEDALATRAMYEAPWDVLIAPLDTAGRVQLKGADYQKILQSQKPVIKALIENYRIWAQNIDWTQADPDTASSTLFDALAVTLVTSPEFCVIEEVQIEVTDDGFTRRKEGGKTIRAALGWNDKAGFETWLADQLTK